MKQVFRFWGYDRDVYTQLLGDSGPMTQRTGHHPTARFGFVRWSEELLELGGAHTEAAANGFPTWLVVDPQTVPEGKALAWFDAPGLDPFPIITQTVRHAHRFHFDVDRTIAFLQNEEYLPTGTPLYVKLGVNPDRLPFAVRHIGLKWFNACWRVKRQTDDRPRVAAVDVWRWLIRKMAETSTAADPVPFWPNGKRFAVVVSHDVDTDYVYHRRAVLDHLRAINESAGMRAAWLVVGKYAEAGRAALDDLHAGGHEIGFHDVEHDHRLAFLPLPRIRDRMAQSAVLRERYGATGFRSPNFLRTPALFRALDGAFEYDMSMHDVAMSTASFAGRIEGCRTCLPFFVRGTDVLEIPTTVPDDVQFEIRGLTDVNAMLDQQWRSIQRIKLHGGLANVTIHAEPPPLTQPRAIAVFQKLLSRLAADPDAWLTTPHALNRHWRRRHEMLERRWLHGESPIPVAVA